VNSLILLAGGSGKRAQQHIPKQFIELDGEKKTRLMFLQYPYSNVKSINFDEVIIVTPSEWKDIITKELSCTNINVTCRVVEGGNTRSESSYLGLQACSSECKKVLIHDAARPFVSEEIYNSCIEFLNRYDSVVPIITSKDTSIYFDSAKDINFINRDKIRLVQTPQAFKYDMIINAYKNQEDEKTDDLQVLLKYNPKAKIKFIEGSEKNFKVTTKNHIDIIKVLYKINRLDILY
tara:strand:+ start:1359 stop:2063 length:705 start_codon:yes stop_codon:yes gene_type:complete